MDQKIEAARSGAGELAEMRRFTADEVCKVFGVPRHMLIEPGHVMSHEKYQKLLEQQKPKQK